MTISSICAREQLAESLAPRLQDVVDPLHVAAILESSGVTDQVALARYNEDDVFALARVLYDERTPSPAGLAISQDPAPKPPAGESRSVLHGVVYLLPSLSIPALLALVGFEGSVLALAVGAAVGWVWAVTATWVAFRHIEARGRESGDSFMRRSVLIAIAVSLGVGILLVGPVRSPVLVGVMATVVTCAQAATTLLLFQHRRRALVALLLVPAALGLGNLLAPDRVPAWLVAVAIIAGVVGQLVAGLVTQRSKVPSPEDAPQLAVKNVPVGGVRVNLTGFGTLVWYALASVAFLMVPQIAFLISQGPLPLVMVGLFLTMGVVEWRSAVLSRRVSALLADSSSVRGFRVKVAARALADVTVCVATTGVVFAATASVMANFGMLTPEALLVGVGTLPLAGGYLLGFVLANVGAYPWLAGAFTLCTAIETAASAVGLAPMTTTFPIASIVLLVTLFVGLLTRPARSFR